MSCLRRPLGQNGENVLISDFQMLASMILVQSAVHVRSASIFLFPRFPASNEPEVHIGGRGGGVRAMMKVA